jgi:hypothetical protein
MSVARILFDLIDSCSHCVWPEWQSAVTVGWDEQRESQQAFAPSRWGSLHLPQPTFSDLLKNAFLNENTSHRRMSVARILLI